MKKQHSWLPGNEICTGRLRFSAVWGMLLVSMVLFTACQLAPASASSHPTSSESQPLHFQGDGPKSLRITWSGPAILHLRAAKGSQPFNATLNRGLDYLTLVSASGAVDEYRGYTFPPGEPAELSIQSDRPWNVEILPVSRQYFQTLKAPGTVQENGNAVILLDGKYGIAIFNIDHVRQLTAWAYGPGGVGEKLYITPNGDYKGRSVLPIGAGWLVVSASGPWSVELTVPCCELKP